MFKNQYRKWYDEDGELEYCFESDFKKEFSCIVKYPKYPHEYPNEYPCGLWHDGRWKW